MQLCIDTSEIQHLIVLLKVVLSWVLLKANTSQSTASLKELTFRSSFTYTAIWKKKKELRKLPKLALKTFLFLFGSPNYVN